MPKATSRTFTCCCCSKPHPAWTLRQAQARLHAEARGVPPPDQLDAAGGPEGADGGLPWVPRNRPTNTLAGEAVEGAASRAGEAEAGQTEQDETVRAIKEGGI